MNSVMSPASSGRETGFVVSGKATTIAIAGTTSMKMISSTSMTSIIGVTLMSARGRDVRTTAPEGGLYEASAYLCRENVGCIAGGLPRSEEKPSRHVIRAGSATSPVLKDG